MELPKVIVGDMFKDDLGYFLIKTAPELRTKSFSLLGKIDRAQIIVLVDKNNYAYGYSKSAHIEYGYAANDYHLVNFRKDLRYFRKFVPLKNFKRYRNATPADVKQLKRCIAQEITWRYDYSESDILEKDISLMIKELFFYDCFEEFCELNEITLELRLNKDDSTK